MEIKPRAPAQAIAVTENSQVGEARRGVSRLAHLLELNEECTSRAATIVVEAATNLVKHTGGKGGELVIQPSPVFAGAGIDIFALDKGPGMRNVSECVKDGFSTGGSQGIGLGGMRRMADVFDIFSQDGQGTAVFARVLDEAAASAPNAGPELGVVGLPVTGETVSGDGWSVREDAGVVSFLLSDGLGHGPLAQEASAEAIAIFSKYGSESLTEVLTRAHGGLRKTRGAAVSMLRIDPAWARAQFAGVGNVCAITAGPEKTSVMVSSNGIVGHEFPRVREYDYALHDPGRVVLFSDGLQSRWDLGRYPGVWQRHSALVAALLYRDFKRGRDDVTVLVARRAPRTTV